MERTKAIEAFLAEVERRALKIAELGLGNTDDALDAVQEAMMKLVSRYAARPPPEWAPLFYRILENRITDGLRRRNVRGRFFAWPGGARDGEDDDEDPLARFPDREALQPEAQLLAREAVDRVQDALAKLPRRQQQAVLLRAWEGLDVAATAAAMNCSEGSVKTHYFRALQSLKAVLEDLPP
ncbi:MAG: RNA polymerase sigma factor [Gammaproteobacteria bacterium]|nr:RNA polymerase sigma factor [Gammaproteobacteria bacterium]